jgi:carboxylesterase
VLLVHGFTGSPWDVRPLAEALARAGFRVRALLLPGHGTTPAALLGVRHGDWTAAVEAALLEEAREGGGRPVGLAGLSMGALLAAQAAARQPGAVGALVLMAPVLGLRGPRMALARLLTRAGLLERLWPWLPKRSTDIEDPAERAAAPVLHALPAGRLHDLFTLQRLVRPALARVRCPALVVSASGDHVVTEGSAWEAARLLRQGAAEVRQVVLGRGFHILPRDGDRERLASEVAAFLALWLGAPEGAAAGESAGPRDGGHVAPVPQQG